MSQKTIGGMLVLQAIALAATAGLTLKAQGVRDPRARPESNAAASRPSIQDALLKPYVFAFSKPTPLNEVAKQLGQTLNSPVVVDRAALDRMSLKIDDEVQLQLEGVRLKTGLKLLLDQLDLTYRVVPEDNLLIVTDSAGSADPLDHVLTQLQSLHRDLHETQDAVNEIRAALGLDAEAGARVRKPTIIEEMPPAGSKDREKESPKESPPSATSPRSRPGV